MTQAGNLYMFVMHNPVRWVDPTGLSAALPMAIIGRGAILNNHMFGITTRITGAPPTFPPPITSGIRLEGTQAERRTTLSYMQSLTDHTLRINSSGYVSIGTHATENLHFTHGNALIERMLASTHLTRIRPTSGANGFAFDNHHQAVGGRGGSGSVIYFNPAFDPLITTADSAGLAVMTRRPAYIGLAHELAHADRAQRGVAIPGSTMRSISFETARARYSPARLFGNDTRTVTHTFQLDEMATIGISNATDNCITENMIRYEHGLPMRLSHNRL